MQEKEGISFVKNLANKVWNYLWGAFIKTAAPKVDKAVENHHMHSLAALTKKNPNMGVHVEQGLNAKQVKALAKEMLKLKQDVFFQRNKTDPEKFDIYVTSGNKTLLEQKRAEVAPIENPETSKPKSKIEQLLESSKQRADEINKARQKELEHIRRVPEKHKEVSL